MNRDLVLLSNSRKPGEVPFAWAHPFLGEVWGKNVKRAALVPFAGVTLSWDEYEAFVRDGFEPMGIEIESVHRHADPRALCEQADAIFVGGGNTFHLAAHLQSTRLMEVIRELCGQGKPYMGWSAGANVAGPTIRTTNDMPIVEPESFRSLGLVSFQINPHYTNASLPGHGGETRDQRIGEFLAANPSETVVGLPEGSGVRVFGDAMSAFGAGELKVFRSRQEPDLVTVPADVSHLLSLT